jgi:ABC-type branched-subunit amino acid transport system permease subunit
MGTSLPGLHMIIYGIILVVVLLYIPQGIFVKLRERMPILKRI